MIDIDQDNNLHVAWIDNSSLGGSGTDNDIYYKMYNDTAGVWGPVEIVSSESTGDSGCLALEIDASGNVHVAWQDNTNYSGSGVDYDVFYKMRDANTATWSTAEVVSSESTIDSKHPALAVSITGDVYLAWDEGESRIILKKRVANTWISIISQVAPLIAREPSICLDNANVLHMVWSESTPSGGIKWGFYVAYRSLNITSSIWSIKTILHGYTMHDVVDDVSSPKIRVDSGGNRHVTFYEFGSIPPWPPAGAIFYLRYDAQRKTWETKPYSNQAISALNDMNNGWNYVNVYASIDVDAARNAYICWGEAGTIKLGWLNGTTKTWIPKVTVDQDNGPPTSLCIDYSEGGNLHIVWSTGLAIMHINYNTLAPVADFSANDTTIKTGDEVRFTFTGKSGQEPTSYQWNFGDGSVNSTDKNPTHAYMTAGTYTVTLAITDDKGFAATRQKVDYIVVVPNQAPNANFTFTPVAAIEGELVQFNDTSVDVDGAVISWKWEFGDGSANSTVECPSHAYTTAGTYTITMTVTDDDGASAIASKTIAIVVPCLYVQDISISYTKEHKVYIIYTTVTVYDAAGSPLPGVTVTITLSPPKGVLYTISGTTGADGMATFIESCKQTKGTYTSTVTILVKTGWVYDLSKNVLTSKSLVIS